ncbi:Carbon monoxide dehydrogenase F protein [Georgfuchsia toluolica]|uniref:Carbon monoxide dehydrogenase F protein n=2 Tax=Georgfuchsia toluolica TaxID=424218 RepID=A0A916J2Y7_9PROT|nr:Carbon monoxide dehydrogenase F protein [Georgfuchsia toluolica]
MASELDDILNHAQDWLNAGHGVALATVVRTWGSSPCPVGNHLAVNAAGDFAGSVSGGCIEGAVIQEAQAVIASGQPRLLEFGVSDDRAWEVGLACGGRVQVFVERLGASFAALMAARAAKRPVATVTRLADGAQARIEENAIAGKLDVGADLAAQVRQGIARGTSGMLGEAGTLFVRVYAPPPRVLIVGAVHITQTLAPMAVMAGYGVVVIDPRRAFASAERFPGVELSDEWPDEAMQRLMPDNQTAVVTLTHDPKLDDPALSIALRSPAFYIGSLGSSRTHAKRIERLTELGLADQIKRIHAPVGLDLGGRYPSEIAVSILAQIIRVRYKGAAQ